MSVKGDKPRDITREYPWGTKTKTYKAWLVLFSINVIVLSGLFLALIEVPELFRSAGDAGSLDVPAFEAVDRFLVWCFFIIVANVILVWMTKTVGGWLSSLEEVCWEQDCNWWCLCCNKWLCIFVSVLKWVTWVVTFLATVITSFLTWVCFNGQLG